MSESALEATPQHFLELESAENIRASERAKSGLGGKSLAQSESPFAVNGPDPNSSDKVTLKSRVTPGETKQ